MKLRASIGTLFLMLLALPAQGDAQSLLVVPDLSVGSESSSTTSWLTGPSRGGVDFDLVGSMSPEISERFWGEATSSILPGSTIGVGSDRAAIYTEIGKVLSGSWRVFVGSALSVATDEDESSEETAAEPENSGLARFIAGGGSLSLGGVRPIVLAKLGEYNRGGLFALPRAWLNVPTLTSAEGIGDYGAEMAGSMLVQRHGNDEKPFLTLEVRGGLVAGSGDFYTNIGRSAGKAFTYIAPSLTVRVRDQINVGVSTIVSNAIVKGDPTFTLSITLLNRKQAEN